MFEIKLGSASKFPDTPNPAVSKRARELIRDLEESYSETDCDVSIVLFESEDEIEPYFTKRFGTPFGKTTLKYSNLLDGFFEVSALLSDDGSSVVAFLPDTPGVRRTLEDRSTRKSPFLKPSPEAQSGSFYTARFNHELEPVAASFGSLLDAAEFLVTRKIAGRPDVSVEFVEEVTVPRDDGTTRSFRVSERVPQWSVNREVSLAVRLKALRDSGRDTEIDQILALIRF